VIQVNVFIRNLCSLDVAVRLGHIPARLTTTMAVFRPYSSRWSVNDAVIVTRLHVMRWCSRQTTPPDASAVEGTDCSSSSTGTRHTIHRRHCHRTSTHPAATSQAHPISSSPLREPIWHLAHTILPWVSRLPGHTSMEWPQVHYSHNNNGHAQLLL